MGTLSALAAEANGAEKAKENGPVGGKPGRLILMRQFGGRFGGYRVSREMVSGLTGVKRGRAKSPRSFSKILELFDKIDQLNSAARLTACSSATVKGSGRSKVPPSPARNASSPAGLGAFASR
jgi:hypothetical protein